MSEPLKNPMCEICGREEGGRYVSVGSPEIDPLLACDTCAKDPKEAMREQEEIDAATQRAEMQAEEYAAEAILGMRPGTTQGWYDEPEPPDPYEDGWEEE